MTSPQINSNERVLVVDVDSVLLDFNAGMHNLHLLLTGQIPKEILPNAFKAHKRWDLSHPQFQDKFREMLANPLYWATLPAMPHAQQVFPLLRNYYSKIYALTAMPQAFVDSRKYNLRILGMQVDEVFVGGGKGQPSKADVIQHLNAHAFIDDLDENFKGMEDLPIIKIHLDNEYVDVDYNFEPPYVVRVPSLYSACRHLFGVILAETRGQEGTT